MQKRIKETLMYCKTLIIFRTQRAITKLKLLKFICTCRNTDHIILIHTFAKGLTGNEPVTVPEEKERPEHRSREELINYLWSGCGTKTDGDIEE